MVPTLPKPRLQEFCRVPQDTPAASRELPTSGIPAGASISLETDEVNMMRSTVLLSSFRSFLAEGSQFSTHLFGAQEFGRRFDWF